MKLISLIKTSALIATTVLSASAASAQSADWTGFYLGAEVGGTNLDSNAPVLGDDSSLIGGFIAGYDYDLGNWVVGAGLDYDFSDASFVGVIDLDTVWRLKLRGGYKIGNGLVYGTGGYAAADLSVFGTSVDDDGYFIGGGYDHKVSQNFSVGGEILYHDFNNFNGSPLDISAVTYQIRGAYRF